MRQPQPGIMNKNKIRKYPPIIVSLAVGAIFMALAIHSAAIGAERMQDYNRPTPGSTYTTFAAELPTTAYLAATQQAPEEKATESEAEAESTYESMIKSRDWDSDDSERLMKIAMAEAESEGVEGKALVMLVVLNRVWSDDFPGTIEEVISQPRQFSVVTEGGRYYTTEPDAECYEALELVLSGWDESYGALYFESCAGSSWHSRNLEFLFEVGNHKFYR